MKQLCILLGCEMNSSSPPIVFSCFVQSNESALDHSPSMLLFHRFVKCSQLRSVSEFGARIRAGAGGGPGRERHSQLAGWAAFSAGHERCDCPVAFPSQESSPSRGPCTAPLSARNPAPQGEGRRRLCQIPRRGRRRENTPPGEL